MPAAETARLVAELTLKDKMSAGIKSATKSVNALDKRLGKMGSVAASGAGAAARNIERAALLGVGAAATGVAFAVNAAIDWQSAMAGVNKTIDATPAQLKEIEVGLIALSNKTPVAATDLAAIAESAGALGIAQKDILSFTETVALIGTTTNVTTDEAATALGQLGNVLQLTGADYDNFAAALVDLGNKGASTEAQILEIERRAGAGAKLIGIAKEATLGWSAAAANLGMNEELAGTSLQNLFLKAMPAFNKGSKTLQAVTGKTAKQLKTAFAKDASGALESFLRDLGKMPKDSRLTAIQKLFGKGSGLTRLVLGLSDSLDRNLAPSLDTATQAWAENTAATAEAEKRFKTTESQLSILKNNVTNAATTIGTNLLPLVNELASELTGWLQTHQGDVKKFGQDLAVGIKEAVTWAKSLDWNQIGTSLKMGADFAKGVVSAFTSAPPWLQQFLVAGFVANKFTGGAVGGIVAELGKGLIRGVLGMNAGVVNVKAGAVTGVGGAGAGAVGGKAGLVGKVGSAVMSVAIVGMAAEVASMLWGVKEEQTTANKGQISALETKGASFEASASTKDIMGSLAGIESYSKGLLNSLTPEAIAYQLNIDGVRTAIEQQMESLKGQLRIQTADQRSELGRVAQLQGTTNARLTGILNKPAQHITVPVTVRVAVSVRDVTRQIITVGRYAGKSIPI